MSEPNRGRPRGPGRPSIPGLGRPGHQVPRQTTIPLPAPPLPVPPPSFPQFPPAQAPQRSLPPAYIPSVDDPEENNWSTYNRLPPATTTDYIPTQSYAQGPPTTFQPSPSHQYPFSSASQQAMPPSNEFFNQYTQPSSTQYPTSSSSSQYLPPSSNDYPATSSAYMPPSSSQYIPSSSYQQPTPQYPIPQANQYASSSGNQYEMQSTNQYSTAPANPYQPPAPVNPSQPQPSNQYQGQTAPWPTINPREAPMNYNYTAHPPFPAKSNVPRPDPPATYYGIPGGIPAPGPINYHTTPGSSAPAPSYSQAPSTFPQPSGLQPQPPGTYPPYIQRPGYSYDQPPGLGLPAMPSRYAQNAPANPSSMPVGGTTPYDRGGGPGASATNPQYYGGAPGRRPDILDEPIEEEEEGDDDEGDEEDDDEDGNETEMGE